MNSVHPNAARGSSAETSDLQERAAAALRNGHFDLAEKLLERGDVTLAKLVENLRIYQAELEIQNEELGRSQGHAEAALARFTALFTTLPVAQLVIDSHGLVVDANPAAHALFGLRARGNHRHFLIRLIDEVDRGRLIDSIAGLRSGDGSTDVLRAMRLRSSGGEAFIGDLHLALLPPAPDTLTGNDGIAQAAQQIICAVLDRTETVRAHQALQAAYDRLEQSQEAYRVLADFSPDWDYWLGPDGEFRYVSPACRGISGHAAEEFLGDPHLLERLIHPDDLAHWHTHMADETSAHGPRDDLLTFRLRAADGGERVIEHACNPVVTPDGRFLGRRGVNRDVTSRARALAGMAESEQKYAVLFRTASQGLGIIQDGRFVSVNRAMLRLLGHQDRAAVTGKRPAELSPAQQPDGDDSAVKADRLLAAALAGELQRFEWEHLRADGTRLEVEVSLMRVELAGAPALLVVWQDLTQERCAREHAKRAAAVFENTSEGIVVTDAAATIVAVNRAFTTITGYGEDEALGQNPRILQSGRHDETFYQGLWASLLGTGQWRGEFWNRRKGGEIYAQRSTITAVFDAHGQVTSFIGVIADITDIKRSEEAIYHLAHHDVLTDLPNRVLLRARVEQALARATRDNTMVALLYVDLDMFKTVNDSLGHPVGDQLLQQVAQAMARQVRPGDCIARVGGDEFAVLMDDLREPNHAADLAARLLGACTTPFLVQGRELYITASIGISVYPMDGRGLDSMLRHADLAMYQAKDAGRNTYRFFTPAMTAVALQRLHIENALRGALTRDEMRLEYQPQVRLADGSLIGVEALLRWCDPQLGDIPPQRFIPVAEEIGLIGELGAWVLERAGAQLLAWDAAGLHVPRMAVNLSVRQLERQDLPEQVLASLARTGLPPARLELEVTESMLMRHVEQVLANLKALRAHGIQIAVDDFGSGFSSLGYLQQLPINRVKIDRAFVTDAATDPGGAAIVRTIIALGRGLGIEVIAEGVETEAQAAFLLAEGCAEAQGYLYGRPMSAAALLSEGLSGAWQPLITARA